MVMWNEILIKLPRCLHLVIPGLSELTTQRCWSPANHTPVIQIKCSKKISLDDASTKTDQLCSLTHLARNSREKA